MNPSEFSEIVRGFLEHARPGRHLYIWYGEEQNLLSRLPTSNIRTLALIDCFSNLVANSLNRETQRRQFVRILNENVERIFSAQDGEPSILVVTGASLLARYGGANVFFNFVNDKRMVVLQVSPEHVDDETLEKLPAYIQFKPRIGLETLKHVLERPENLVTEEQE